MAPKKPNRVFGTLVYPKHLFQPEDLLRFIELKPFSEGWEELKLNDDDLLALQILIMLNPKGAPVVKGTGGLRKMRFAPVRWQMGKRGAARIGYCYLEEHSVVLLVIVYSKKEKDDLSPEERSTIRALIQRIEKQFASGLVH